MIQKIGIVFFLLCGFFGNAQAPKEAFIIKGIVEGEYNNYIYLKTTDKVIKDSCLVVNNKFNFSGNVAEGAVQATLELKKTSTVAFFYLENSPIEMTVVTSVFKNGNQDINDVEIKSIKGSKSQVLMVDVDQYQKEIEKSTLSKEEKNKKIYKKYYESVTMNPEYPIADFLISKTKNKPILTVDQVADLSKFAVQKTERVNEKDTLKIQNKAPISKKLQLRKKMEDFTLNSSQLKKVSISDFKGKYVLIDFWASWYKPSRINNYKFFKIHQKYKSYNFEMVSISIDTNNKAWLEAIEKDKMGWVNLIDTDGWHGKVVTQFEVKGIPLNILLDKNGTIIGVNLTGDELREKLDYCFDISPK